MLGTARPYIRWWWLSGPFQDADIRRQLEWLKEQGFGGVEVAWLLPLWDPDGFRAEVPVWCGGEFSRLIGVTKREADRLELGCDFTFGSAWPFCSANLDPAYRSQDFDGSFNRTVQHAWEAAHSDSAVYAIDHLSARALQAYADELKPAFRLASTGSPLAFFCDSFEIPKQRLWSPSLWDEFEQSMGYSLRDRLDDLESDPHTRYDYRKFVGNAIVREFYEPFTALCHEFGAVSRMQCHGAPADLLRAYAAADVPESEALLFEPHFSRIPGSAAAWSGKPVVSCETFTCIYGFPRGKPYHEQPNWKREDIADLKLLADSLFANGVNHVVWHGMPYNRPGGTRTFYAYTHVGPDCAFADQLPKINRYLTRVSEAMRNGQPYAGLAVYLPNEDMMMWGTVPRDKAVPGEEDYWEMRHVRLPVETEGYAPLWVSAHFLRQAQVIDGAIAMGPARVPAVYVDVAWLDGDSLDELLRLGRSGAAIVLVRRPKQPGVVQSKTYEARLDELESMATTYASMEHAGLRPLLEANSLPYFWVREVDDCLLAFLAHPEARDIRYPMERGQAHRARPVEVPLVAHRYGRSHQFKLRLDSGESALLRVTADGVEQVEIPNV